MLAWIGVDGRLIPRTQAQTPGYIHLTDKRGIPSKIEYKASDKPNVGLGFSLTPLGLQEPEFAKRLEQAKSCAAAMATARLSVTETWLALVTRIISKITYPFMLTSFTLNQTMKISVIMENVVLPKLGINRKTPKAVVYGPLDLGGMGYPSFHTIQDQRGIGHVVKHLKWGKDVGKDFRILLSAA